MPDGWRSESIRPETKTLAGYQASQQASLSISQNTCLGLQTVREVSRRRDCAGYRCDSLRLARCLRGGQILISTVVIISVVTY